MDANHRKESLSVAYVRTIAAVGGYTVATYDHDFESVDLTISKPYTTNPDARVENPKIDIQLKATSQKQTDSENIIYDLPIKNYTDLRKRSSVPRLLVILQLPEKTDEWITQEYHKFLSLHNCSYYISLNELENSNNLNSVRIRIPKTNVFSVEALNELMHKIETNGRL